MRSASVSSARVWPYAHVAAALLSGPAEQALLPVARTSAKAPLVPGCQDEGMRIDPDPAGPELVMLSQYLDYQRETMLSKTGA